MVRRVLLCCYSTFTEGRVKRDRVLVAMVVCSGFGHVSSVVCSAVRQRLPVKVHSYLFGNINYSCKSVFFSRFLRMKKGWHEWKGVSFWNVCWSAVLSVHWWGKAQPNLVNASHNWQLNIGVLWMTHQSSMQIKWTFLNCFYKERDVVCCMLVW